MAIQKAVELSVDASPSEKAYIQAMAKRFPGGTNVDRRKAAEEYHDAMRAVAKQFPDDLDAATLFAESGMDLHPWGLWHPDGTPEVGTDEIVATLESVIRRDPNHMGAVHYYIHAVEASPSPEKALAGANKLASLAPAAGYNPWPWLSMVTFTRGLRLPTMRQPSSGTNNSSGRGHRFLHTRLHHLPPLG